MRATILFEQAHNVELEEFFAAANKACSLMGGWKHGTCGNIEEACDDNDCPRVTASSSWSYTTDYDVKSIEKDPKDGHIVINAVDCEGGCDTKLCVDDIESGNLQWLTEAILYGIADYYANELTKVLKGRENNLLEVKSYVFANFMFGYGTQVKMEFCTENVQLCGDEIMIHPITNVLQQEITLDDIAIEQRIEFLELCLKRANNEEKQSR